jgi:hypothetical protein
MGPTTSHSKDSPDAAVSNGNVVTAVLAGEPWSRFYETVSAEIHGLIN